MSSGTARDYHLLLPAGWVRVPLDDRVTERVVMLAETQVRALPAERRADARRSVVRLIGVAVHEAAEAGGTDLLMSVGNVNGVPVSASGLVSHFGAGTAGLDELRDRLADDGGDVSVVTVAGAAAVRRHRRREVPYDAATARGLAVESGLDPAGLPEPDRVTADEVAFFVPIPGRGDLLAFTFSSAQPELAAALVRLFDAIMGTMRWIA